jgi:DNA modification methylase
MPPIKASKAKLLGQTEPVAMFDASVGQHVPKSNRLYYGDNLTIMREMPSASVDLIYLDPPFNSQRTYNLIYTKLTGLPLPEQEEAFCDAWQMDAEKDEMAREIPIVIHDKYGVSDDVAQFWRAWISALRKSQSSQLAYLVYMTYRLFEMQRLLKPNGSIYLHCDPSASHYIKVMMDAVFGHSHFLNEIIWKRTGSHNSAKRYGPVHDVILFYSGTGTPVWNPQYERDEAYDAERYTYKDTDGRLFYPITLHALGTRKGESGKPWRGIDITAKGGHWKYQVAKLDELDAEGRIYWPKKVGGMPRLKVYAEEAKGAPLQDVWTTIPPVNAQADERLGYPTQKPIALLDRIIRSSTNPGDVVFDPFCGCGTAVYAAHSNGRRWIGCDIAILSVQIVRDVLEKRYGLHDGEHYKISGVPKSVDAARDLFERDTRQFQHWVVELAGGFVNSRYSGDQGIDGRLYFGPKEDLRSMVLSVKGGKITPAFMRELRGTLEADGTEMAGFLSLEEPTKGMQAEAAKAGMFTYEGVKYPRMQIRTVKELLNGYRFDTPSRVQTLSQGKERQTKLAL